MLAVINQFRRIINDDGRNDKSFVIEENRLKWALANLKYATDEVIRASQTLHDVLASKGPPKLH